MQSTGQTSTHDLSLMSMQGSAMMYVTLPTLAKRSLRTRQLVDELSGPLDERRLHEHLVEAGSVAGGQAGGIGVVRVADDRPARGGVRALPGIDPGDVDDHEIRRIGVIDRDQVMLREERLELAPEEQVDPTQQDRRHTGEVRTHA